MKRSKYSLWGPQIINGHRCWGVNERREYGSYNVSGQNGLWTRREAMELLKELRKEERAKEERA